MLGSATNQDSLLLATLRNLKYLILCTGLEDTKLFLMANIFRHMLIVVNTG